MDPISITANVLKVTTSLISAATALHDLRNAWIRAPLTITTLHSQLRLTATSLSQLQSLLSKHEDVFREKPELVETFDTTLMACVVVSSALEKYMRKITKKGVSGCDGGSSASTWRVRLRTIWSEGQVRELLELLGGQQTGINMLIDLLKLDSMEDMKIMMRQQETFLRRVAADT